MNRIAIIGLGYVGLPLARLFATKYNVVGYDINKTRIEELRNGHDRTLELEDDILQAVLINKDQNIKIGLYCTSNILDIEQCNIFIITVPTPIDKYNRPDLTPLQKASETVANVLKKGDLVIYESTVYPGATEEECIPVLEKISNLRFNIDFFAGYSPERINPGDKEHTVEKILKVTSGSTEEIGKKVDDLYKSVISAGTHLAPSIKVAEAAKVIENSQRDINIAFVNELAKIFSLMNIDTNEVLKAAATKWNFLSFKPGLVGGHCIGVDPYYLAQKAQEVGYHPEVILAGRRLNDGMGNFIATEVVKLMMRRNLKIFESNLLILGITFKENCPDVRNTRVVDIYNELRKFDIRIDVFDPLASYNDVKAEYGIEILRSNPTGQYSAVILAVAHKEFLDIDVRSFAPHGIVYDVKGVLPREAVDLRL
jgi:UDP-N-acetyl-D-glucosamine/UDP-N-acetyl-D-galactosamine dehydrogenase